MKIYIDQLVDFLGSSVVRILGTYTNEDYIDNLADVSNVNYTTLDWVNSVIVDKKAIVLASKAHCLLIDESLEYDTEIATIGKILIVVDNPKLAIVKIGNKFFVKKPKPFIHPTAVIAEDAVVGKNVYIGAYAVIGSCKIGDNTIIHPHVVINDCVEIGSNVVVKPGAVLGFDGFGYERDENNNLVRFPQIGRLFICDNVEIGAHTCIDRGALSNSIIGLNTKINNLCHIAHNVVIGTNTIITGEVNISGSTIIGNDVWIAPNSTLRGHQRIGNNVFIGMGSVVTKNIPNGEMWYGSPAKKIK